MVSGHLAIKGNRWYAILCLRREDGSRCDTLGYTATANQNGYHTECTLDLSGAVLDYDGLAVLNRYRAESGKNCGDAVWAYGDMTEEQALAGAKYHDRGGNLGRYSYWGRFCGRGICELQQGGGAGFLYW